MKSLHCLWGLWLQQQKPLDTWHTKGALNFHMKGSFWHWDLQCLPWILQYCKYGLLLARTFPLILFINISYLIILTSFYKLFKMVVKVNDNLALSRTWLRLSCLVTSSEREEVERETEKFIIVPKLSHNFSMDGFIPLSFNKRGLRWLDKERLMCHTYHISAHKSLCCYR